jgi:hypothetical protein
MDVDREGRRGRKEGYIVSRGGRARITRVLVASDRSGGAHRCEGVASEPRGGGNVQASVN